MSHRPSSGSGAYGARHRRWGLSTLFVSLIAATQVVGQSYKDPRLGDGFEMNNPTGGWVMPREYSAMTFVGESQATAALRVVIGTPRLESVPYGTDVLHGQGAKLGVELSAADGRSRARLALPTAFKGGMMRLDIGPFQAWLPILSTEIGIDVPALLMIAQATFITDYRLSFFVFNGAKIEKLEFKLTADLTGNKVLVQY